MNKQVFLLSVAIAFLMFVVPYASALTDITNCTDLQSIANNLTENYQLVNNIDCSDTTNWNSGEGFVPIQNFNGIFNGQGYNISDLVINRPTETQMGLFGLSNVYMEIKNVGILNGNVSGKSSGGLASDIESGFVDNSFYEGVVYCTDGNCGGLIGYTGEVDVNNSHVVVTIIGVKISGANSIGGLIGFNGKNIYNSYAIATITGDLGYNIGGLVGYNYGKIYNSYSIVIIDSGNEYVGGLVGWINSGSVYNSYAIGTINGTKWISGFVGGNYNGLIVNSYSISNVTGVDIVGGFIGESYGTSANITNSFANSNVIGTSNVGGFASQSYDGATCTNSYWNTDNGVLTSACATGKTTEELMTETTFENWDFATIWHYQTNCLPALFGQPFLYCFAPEEIIVPSTDKGLIYDIMNSAGAGIGLFFIYLAGSLPLLIIGILIAVMVVVIGSSFIGIFRGAKLKV